MFSFHPIPKALNFLTVGGGGHKLKPTKLFFVLNETPCVDSASLG
jgi:hypothetical protein